MESEEMRCGRYRLMESVAVGGMGEIFLARDEALNRNVVIKRLLEDLTRDPEQILMFLDEARAIAAIDHPNIVTVYDLGRDGEQYFIAMELLLGWDLHQTIARARKDGVGIPIGVALRIISDLALGLHAAHTATDADSEPLHLVHRDVSPHNLFVTEEGVPKLLDFGIAKTTKQRRMTAANVIRGKPAYMSPEQMNCEQLDAQSDVFSLGTVLFELLTGEPLFVRNNPREIYLAITREPIPPAVRDGSVVPPCVSNLLLRALERSRNLRYQTALELSNAAKACLVELVHTDQTDVGVFLTHLFKEATVADAPHLVSSSAQSAPRPLWTEALPVEALPVEALPVFAAVDTEIADEVTAVDGSILGDAKVTVVDIDPMRRRATALVARMSTLWRERRWLVTAGAAILVGMFGAVLMLGGSEPAPTAAEPPVAAAVPEPVVPVRAPPPKPVPPVGIEPPAAANPTARSTPDSNLTTRAKVRASRPSQPRAIPARRVPPRRKAATSTPARKAATVPAAPGSLTLQSQPWANVYLDDELLGPTPLIKYVLPAGRTQLRLVNPEHKLQKTITVEIPSGANLRRKVDM